MKQPSLFEAGDVPDGPPTPPDQAAREFAIEPHHDVVLEASAGTGKTRVLVDRYVRLIEQGVDPRNILAITFTRKAAAEMRERVLVALRRRALEHKTAAERWHVLRDRIADIQISTIDAFCFGLLREFPLEANVEPGFDIADETEMGRFGREAMDRALRIARGLIAGDEALRLLFTRVKTPVLSRAVEELLDRRHVALPAVAIYVKRHAGAASAAEAADAFVRRLQQVLAASSHRTALLDQGPLQAPEYRWLQADLTVLGQFSSATDLPRIQQLRRRLERYFLTSVGEPRKKAPPAFKADQYASKTSKKAHDDAVLAVAPLIHDELRRLEESINALLAHGLLRLLHIAASAYETLLEEHGLLDFAGMLDKSVELLSRQEEFARSRLKLQSRYHHVLVDEFQDTSRQQWRLIELLVDAWGEGEGVTDAPTSIFIVGDRKQSIYRFRHAEVTLLDEAARKISGLRPGRPIRQVITTSFRAVPELLTFVNAMAGAIQSERTIPERFTYDDRDRFPAPGVADGALRDGEPVLGLVAERSMAACASAVAAEIDRLVGRAMVRTKDGPPRHVRPDDIAILFRARAGHQYFETALESRGIRTYVYKGLGFFDAPEVQDLQALMRFLAQPDSDLRAAEFLRSRFVRLSDAGLARLAPGFADALLSPARPAAAARLDRDDCVFLDRARQGVADWRPQADRLPPSELVDRVLRDSAYMFEMRGRRLGQARENVKKVRALVRRVESRGYATLGRIAEYFETLRAGDESNAILEASGCVNLMTMHAAKGLEFPIVFLVNLQAPGRGRGGGFTLVERGPQEEPEVAFTSNEATALEDAREAEELRRLFYVGATRARDRLYFAAQLDARGQLRRAGRSLAGLLPQSVLALFAEAAASPDLGRVTWASPEGRFTFSVCRAQDPPPIRGDVEKDAVDADRAPLDIAWLEAGRAAPVAAAVTVDEVPPAASPAGRKKKRGSPVAHERLIGTIVHRLFQRQWDPPAEMKEAGRVPDLVSAEELVDVADPASVMATAAETYVRLRQRPDVQEVLSGGSCYYEVPFSLADPALEPSAGGAASPSALLRGVIDCLVVPESGPPTVLEFKTGGPRPEHEAQAARYAQAVRTILGTNRVNIKILYA